jgi:hypothetical protein
MVSLFSRVGNVSSKKVGGEGCGGENMSRAKATNTPVKIRTRLRVVEIGVLNSIILSCQAAFQTPKHHSIMSTEIVQKRGRPKKVVDDDVSSSPKEAPTKATKKASGKVATKATYSKGIASPTKARTNLSTTGSVPPNPRMKADTTTKAAAPSSAKPKAVVSKAISESIILQELAASDAIKQSKRLTATAGKLEPVRVAIDNHILTPTPSLEELETTAQLPPALPVPAATITIPSQQSSTMPSIPIPLLYAHNPTSSILQKAAYMSTKSTKTQAGSSKPKHSEGGHKTIPLTNYMSPKEFNKLAVEELSSRRGAGSGAESTRQAQANAEAPKVGKPLTYKSTARR